MRRRCRPARVITAAPIAGRPVTGAQSGAGPLSPRFDTALVLSADLHRRQVRKGSQTPYLAHLLAVAGLVLEQGGSEDEAIAGLLHDAVEDQGGPPTLARIRSTFGDRVTTTAL